MERRAFLQSGAAAALLSFGSRWILSCGGDIAPPKPAATPGPTATTWGPTTTTSGPTMAEQLATFVRGARFEDLTPQMLETYKMHVLDTMGCAIGALSAQPMKKVRAMVDELSAPGRCMLIGGGKVAIDLAALYNSSLERYLDFNDTYLAPGESLHPSDNLPAVLAACEYAGGSGRDFLTALAVAYQVQCRLSYVAPVRARGFDHTTQGAYAVASGVSRALGLDQAAASNAIAICGTAYPALRVTRSGLLSNWKGLAYPNTAFNCTSGAMLARHGITAPLDVFEGVNGFMQDIAGPFTIDWTKEKLDIIPQTSLKLYDAEFHGQSAIADALEIQQKTPFKGADVARVDIEIFQVAYDIIGGGIDGDKDVIHTKEQADHSLPYMVAVALLDGQVTEAQYTAARIASPDVQTLLKKVRTKPADDLSKLFPARMPVRMTITLNNGQKSSGYKDDYYGFYTRPWDWKATEEKFQELTAPFADSTLRGELVRTVKSLDTLALISQLTDLLGRVGAPR